VRNFFSSSTASSAAIPLFPFPKPPPGLGVFLLFTPFQSGRAYSQLWLCDSFPCPFFAYGEFFPLPSHAVFSYPPKPFSLSVPRADSNPADVGVLFLLVPLVNFLLSSYDCLPSTIFSMSQSRCRGSCTISPSLLRHKGLGAIHLSVFLFLLQRPVLAASPPIPPPTQTGA